MKVLALDFGTARIGLAVGDSANRVALPRGILLHDSRTFQRIGELCRGEGIAKIVLGMPSFLQDRESPQQERVREFAANLQDFLASNFPENSIGVSFFDERFSTVEAQRKNRLAGQKHFSRKVDAQAAANFLQTFLETLPEK